MLAFVFFGASPVTGDPSASKIQLLHTYIAVSAGSFDSACKRLLISINKMDAGEGVSIESTRNDFKACRVEYKRIAFFLEYFFPGQNKVFNSAAKVEVEEPSLEYEQPRGLQQIESLLYEKNSRIDKKQLSVQATLVEESARDVPALLYRFTCNDRQIVKSVTGELIRVKCLYLAGYDCQLSKNGLAESAAALESIKKMFESFIKNDSNAKELMRSFDDCIAYLHEHNDRDAFDYSWFLTGLFAKLEQHICQLLEGLGMTAEYLKLPLRYDKKYDKVTQKALISFGGEIFSDKSLSGNGEISCASCHEPGHFYTEPVALHERFDKKGFLQRNTPSLLYSTYQSSEFWDGRAASLSEQIKDVLTSPTEMNSRTEEVVKKVNKNKEYRLLLHKANGKKIEFIDIERGLTEFLSSLSPFSSRFDLFINGKGNALSKDERHGFNIFIGKAQCGTCHFIPLFNGEIPPEFKKTEYEVLGTPASDEFLKPVQDCDPGRRRKYESAFYQGAFKTPSLRNVAQTAPYMHNGKFKTLEKVLEFYNLGGGNGIGLNIPNQTLRDEPLSLTKKEIADIVAFLGTLSDEVDGSSQRR